MDLKSQFKTLKAEHKINPYPSLQERKKMLLALKKAFQNEGYSLAEAVSKDFTHRSVDETLFSEVFLTINAIKYCLKELKHWMKNRKRNVSWILKPAYVYLSPQPLGVVGIMVPWNYPILMSLVPALYALAAGNRVMIKMSELSINIGLALQSLIKSIGLEQFICVVNGDVELAKEFSALPFGHLIFTGSTQVGKLVMKAASNNLTPLTLELGGKSPAVLSKTMNIKYFNRLFMGKLFNAAQSCVAPDYLLIPSGWNGLVEDEFKNFIENHFPDLMNNDNYSSIISEPHKQRLLALIEDARSKGARVVSFGELNPEGTKLPMYLLFDVTNDMNVMKEEIFGPILPVLNYSSFNEAVECINNAPNPLALYYFGEDKVEINCIQNKTLSGALTINDTAIHVAVDDLPFGGVGYSGMGHYHGKEGFDTFSKLKPVMVQRRLSPMTFLYPPYGRLLRLALSWIGGIKMK